MEKFNLLRHSLSGKALDAIAHLQWEESHYALAKEIIHERFGDSKLARNSHIREIDKLLERGLIQYHRLESFSETLSLNVKALLALDNSYAELSTATMQRILRCLPTDLREKFIRKLAKRKLSDPLITDLESMLEFLNLTVKVRREAELEGGGFPQRDSRRPTFHQGEPPASKPRHSQHQAYTPHRATHNFFTSGQKQSSGDSNQHSKVDKSCIFCGDDHESFRCRATLTLQERRERVIQQKACWICLKRNHSAKTCRDGPKRNCAKCNGRHYVIMCKKAQLDTASFMISTVPTTTTTEATSSVH
ncbi:uncharacterized protein LOC100898682, partial [Galendromus occidentalis]|uniref:Uncharacterized protein LOC100898682 n=1 Tax=Galendromus occidentalis TaxID=34638 RepID=A0AAJ6QPT3_9ACAR